MAAIAESPPVVTVADMLHEVARIAAAREVLKQHEDRIRRRLRAECDQLGEQTGTAANLNVKGVARAYVTEPSLKPRVTDKAEYEQLLRESGEGRERTTVDCSGLQADLDQGHLTPEVLQVLGPYLRDEVLPPEGWLDDRASKCVVTDDGTLVDPETGVKLPVVMEQASRPTLTVRVDSQHRKRLAAELAQRFPAIEGGA